MTALPPVVLSLIHAPDPSPERSRLEDAVRRAYTDAHGAHITHFLPLLLGLDDARGELLGAVGAQLGDEPRPMFLEAYLDEAVEQAVSRATRTRVPRSALAEVGNLAARQPGAGFPLISTLAAYFDGAGVEWAVFTATMALRWSFERRGIEMRDLGAADGRRLGARLADWGRYYETQPRMTAVHIGRLRESLARDERLGARCAPAWEEARKRGLARARSAA
jgi:hypothetical protein